MFCRSFKISKPRSLISSIICESLPSSGFKPSCHVNNVSSHLCNSCLKLPLRFLYTGLVNSSDERSS